MTLHFNRVNGSAASYCLNPQCPDATDPLNAQVSICRNCDSKLLLQDRYRVIKPLGKGGTGQTFEVNDQNEQGTLKVLKVLNLAGFGDLKTEEKLIDLFQQEAKVLSRLHHIGIPQGDGPSFPFWPKDSQEPLHCLVMEKIDGQTLQEWLEDRNHQPITQAQALTWLKQLVEILEQVHQQRYFHRDIKPSNIMLRPNGHLVLIDFGAVKECTQTYLQQQNVKGTLVGSPGYAPPEQINGRSEPQSDFFALGRTFVHLLTGKHPLDLHENPNTGKLIWRDEAPHIPKLGSDLIYKLIGRSLADFIDELMQPETKKRPKNTRVILQRLNKIGRHPLLEIIVSVTIFMLIAATGVYWYLTGVNGCSKIWLRSFPIGDNLSCGEEILVRDFPVMEKQEGIKAFADGKYTEAVDWLKKARHKQYNDPETLIYLNNAQLLAKGESDHTISVAVPLSGNPNSAKEILRGVSQAQDEFNRKRKPTDPGLKVLIADDQNTPAKAQQIAKALVDKRDILAVVGHLASDITVAVLPIYQDHGLTLISATSTSETIRNQVSPNNFFFRTVPGDHLAAQALASFLSIQAEQPKVAIFYNPHSNFTTSLRDYFRISFPAKQVVAEFDLSDPNLNTREAIDSLQTKGVTAFALFPDAQITEAFRNALEVVKVNQGRSWIVGADTMYTPQLLRMVGSEAVEHLVVAIPWHGLSSPNPKFPQTAHELWGGTVSWRTALGYDAASVLGKVLELPHPNRSDMQKMLASTTFDATGATGEITFQPNGDRQEPVDTLVKVVLSNCSSEGYAFVPISYSSRKAESLEPCRKEK